MITYMSVVFPNPDSPTTIRVKCPPRFATSDETTNPRASISLFPFLLSLLLPSKVSSYSILGRRATTYQFCVAKSDDGEVGSVSTATTKAASLPPLRQDDQERRDGTLTWFGRFEIPILLLASSGDMVCWILRRSKQLQA